MKLDAGEYCSSRLGFDPAGRLPINVQEVVRKTMAGNGKLMDRYAQDRVDAQLLAILDEPPHLCELPCRSPLSLPPRALA